ncbi:MAG TPA: alpha/beta hydrolase [Solirubrobacteraceae bacterium]
MPTFTHAGHRIAYTEHGSGPRAIVLIHGLLLSQRMHLPLAKDLANRGHRVITIDLLGHGASDRPRDMWRYSMPAFGEQVIALLDHLELDDAIVGGTSLGANVTLEACAIAQDRVRGMLIEMPVLDNALLGCAVAFSPMLLALTVGQPLMRIVQMAAKAVPESRVPFFANILLDWVRQDPGPSGAVLQGLFFGRIAPPRAQRRLLEPPALVIGHHRDPVHPFSDTGMLVEELPNGRLLEASSMLELRISPGRITGEIADFLDECWRPRGAKAPGRSATRRKAG